MYKHLKKLLTVATVLLSAGLFTACSEDEAGDSTPTNPSSEEVSAAVKALLELAPDLFVVNQGNAVSGIEGSITAINTESGERIADVFQSINALSLGESPQNIFLKGSRAYVPVFSSNIVWVISTSNFKQLRSLIVLAPEYVVADSKYVYVASNYGFVTRFNAETFEEDAHIEVGPNPAGLALAGGNLYVSISDGYNYENGYVNGKKVVRIDCASWKKQADIEVGLNPGKIEAAASGRVYVVCHGYWDDDQSIYEILPDDKAQKLADGSDLSVGGSQLYVAQSHTDWTTYVSSTRILAYNAETSALVSDDVLGKTLTYAPTFIHYDASRGYIVLGEGGAGGDYTAEGRVHLYHADGLPYKSFDVGVQPFAVMFK